MGLPPLLALAALVLEWMALGWLSGVRWPGGPAAPWWASASLCLLGGAVLQAEALILLALAGAPVNSVPVGLIAAAVLALGVRGVQHLVTQPSGRTAEAEEYPYDWRERVGWVLLLGVLIGAGVRSWLVPEAGWDAYSHWGLKALAYFQSGAIVDTHGAHEYYPPLVPLLETWLSAFRGSADIAFAKTIWPAVGAAFGLCLAWHARLALARRWLAPWVALACLLLTTQLLDNFWTGQADLALTTFLSLGVLALFQWQTAPEHARTEWLAQAMVLFGGAALCKFEGLYRVAVPCLALGVEVLLVRTRARRTVLAGVVCGAAALAFFLPWAVYRQVHGFSVSNEHVSHLQLLALPGVLRTLLATLGGIRAGGGIVVAVLGPLAAWRLLVRPPRRFLLVTTAGQLAATMLAFLITDYSPELQVSLSATRLFMQLMPPMLFAVAIGLEQVLGSSSESSSGPRHPSNPRDPAAILAATRPGG